MGTYKNFVLTLLLALSALCMAQAATQEQMRTTESFDYSNFTYTWTDADGNTQTAKLTDKATTTEQIMALLAEVYCNPRIPGIHYAYHYNGNNLGEIDYNANADTARLYWPSNYFPSTIETPDEGCTILLVEMKNDWTVSKSWNTTVTQYIARCYESVQLLDKNKYIADSDNPGYLVSIDGISTNRFFFLSKGKGRNSNNKPLYRLYEQISPVEYGHEGETVDFSSSIRNGDLYYMEHDCADVPTIGGGHEFTVSEEGESYSFKNLTFFLPDRRFQVTDVDRKWNNSFTYYKWDNSPDTWRPRNLMYLVTQNDPTLQAAGNNTYNVGLSWTTSFDSAKLGLDVPQTYYIYATVDDKTTLLGTTDDIQNYNYSVPQRKDAYSITYTIVSSPMQSNITATSLTKTVVIPGMGTPFFMQGAKYRSRYEMDKELNIYKNTLTVQASTESDYNNLSSVTTPYTLVRTNADGTDKTIVANVTFSSDHSYKVEYVDDTQDYGNLFDSEKPVTEGTMDSHTATITFIDRFTVSTKTNEQPAGYSYVLRFGDQISSNVCAVPVYKTTNSVSLHGVTKAQADADTKHAATEDQYTSITFTAISQASANVQDYTVFCDEQTHSHRSGKAEVSSTGTGTGSISYIAMGRNTTGAINVNQGTFAIDEGSTAQITVTDYSSTTPASLGFVPVVTTYYNGNSSEPNTYGCDIKNTALPSFTLSVSEVARVSDTWKNGDGSERTAYTATLSLTPNMNTVVPYVYYYRVWRVEPDGTETLLNTSKDIAGKGWTTTYGNIKGYYPSSSDATTTCDIYLGDVPAPTREVTYIARMYSTTTNDASADASYYISEQRVTVTYDDSKIVTGVTQVTAGSPATSVTYYNLTGQPSTTPWQGVNVAVTRHADGTTTSKAIISNK